MRLFFSHIPKCGGTKIRELLRSFNGDELCETEMFEMPLQVNGFPDLREAGFNTLTGHFGPTLLDWTNLSLPTFTWIRNPLVRRMSSVFHNARHQLVGSRPIAGDYLSSESELEYIRTRFLTEDDFLYSKLWGGMEHRADFVGRTEHFDEDWCRCYEFFDFPISARLRDTTSRKGANPLSPDYDDLLCRLGLDPTSVCKENSRFEYEFEVYENLLERAA